MAIFHRMFFDLANLASFEDVGESCLKTLPSGVYRDNTEKYFKFDSVSM